MKIQKYLSQSGVCSRRKAEEYIAEWLVLVNGSIAHIWQVINPETDTVVIDNKIIKDTEELVYYKLNKPRWVVTTCVSHEDTGILDIVDIPERVFPIGRLDKETTGLIILTNDGRLSNYLMHPRYEHEKEYIVEVYGKIDDQSLEKLSKWVKIELKDNGTRKSPIYGGDGMGMYKKVYKTKPCSIERLSSSKFSITIREWKNRQIRRMVAAVWFDIKRLKRIRIENVLLWDIKEGEYEKMSFSEKNALLKKIMINEGVSINHDSQE